MPPVCTPHVSNSRTEPPLRPVAPNSVHGEGIPLLANTSPHFHPLFGYQMMTDGGLWRGSGDKAPWGSVYVVPLIEGLDNFISDIQEDMVWKPNTYPEKQKENKKSDIFTMVYGSVNTDDFPLCIR